MLKFFLFTFLMPIFSFGNSISPILTFTNNSNFPVLVQGKKTDDTTDKDVQGVISW